MQDIIVSLFENFFTTLATCSDGLNVTFGTAYAPYINSIALAIKPIGYSLLALFALLEFVQLSERMGNINGFAGTGLVIEVLIKIILCKLVVDNSTEICSFLMTLADNISSKIGSVGVTQPNYNQLLRNIENAFPSWWDIFGQLGFFIVSALFIFLADIAIIIVKVIFTCRYIEIYVLTAVSPIPLSTCLSKSFNIAPNFIKNLFAVGLQGGLLMLVIRLFNYIFAGVINGVGVLAQNDWGALWSMLGSLLSSSIVLLVCAFQTQKWAKSICHAM